MSGWGDVRGCKCPEDNYRKGKYLDCEISRGKCLSQEIFKW